MIPYRLLSAALLLTAAVFAAAESYEERAKRTDMGNADAVFQLAAWCQENELGSKSHALLLRVLKLDRDHAEARAALGQVRVGNRWVDRSQVRDPPGGRRDDQDAAPSVTGLATAPVTWDLTLPHDPDPDNAFLDGYIAQMNSASDQSAEMETAIATALTEENLPSALPRVCAMLLKPETVRIYGPSEMALALLKGGRHEDARRLMGFIATASARCTASDDLQTFCFAAGGLRDKRVLPRLIELMRGTDKDLTDAATAGAAAITGLPAASLTDARAAAWWAKFQRLDDHQILLIQARAKDADTAIGAASQLAVLGDKQAIDTFIAWMASDDVKIAAKAHLQLSQFLGSDWAFIPTDPKDVRLKRLDLLTKWWKANRDSFTLIVDERLKRASAIAQEPSAAADEPLALAVRQIGSANPKAALRAESQLIAAGEAAAPQLIAGLSSDDPITARKCHELLGRLAPDAGIRFDPRGPLAQRQQAIDAWRAWAAQRHLPGDQDAGGGATAPQ